MSEETKPVTVVAGTPAQVKALSALVAATPAAAPTAPPAVMKKAYVPRGWNHHKEDAEGRPIPPGPTWVYFEAGNPQSGVLCKTEEEYIDALNRGGRDTFDQKAWK